MSHGVSRVFNCQGNSRAVLELIPEKAVPPHQVKQHVLVGRADLVVHFMTSVGYLKASSLEKLLNILFSFEALPEVPVCKEPSLVVSESSSWVLPKRLNSIREEVVEMPLH